MRTQTRQRLLQTTTSIPRKSILSANPQIQDLVHRLLAISQVEQKPKCLKARWQREKYQPNEFQNRLKIQNEVSLKKIHNQKVRSRVKPVKKLTIVLNKPMNELQAKSYKQHYEDIKRAQQQATAYKPDEQGEEQEEPFFVQQQPKQGIKYYSTLRKYSNIIGFIEDRKELSSKKQKNLHTSSQTQPTLFKSTQASMSLKPWRRQKTQQPSHQNRNKIYTLMSKWKSKKIQSKGRNKTTNSVRQKEDINLRTIANSAIEIQGSFLPTKRKGLSQTKRDNY